MKKTVSFQLLVEGVGVVFCAVFLAAYLFALPTNEVLHSEPIHRGILTVFGGLFLILVVASLLLSGSKDSTSGNQ